MPSPRALRLSVLVVTLSLAYGIWYSYSVVLVALLREFGWPRAVLAGAFSVFTLVHGGSSPFVGMLCERFRPLAVVAVGGIGLALAVFAVSFVSAPWQLYAGYGVCTALAVACSGWPAALVQVQRDFQDRLGLALGIVSSGVGVGMLVVAPLTQALIEAWGWRAAYRVLAVLCVLWIAPSALWLLHRSKEGREARATAPARAGGRASSARSTTLAEAVRGQPFWLLFATFFLGNICTQTLHVHQVAYLVDHGVAAMVAAAVVSVVGGASIVGKIGGGWLSDRMEREFVFLGGIAILVSSIGVLVALGAGDTAPAAWMVFAYALLMGLGYSVTASLTPALIADRFSGPQFGRIVGLGLFGAAAGSATGPWFAGLVFDRTGSYVVAFAVAAACGLLAATACWRARSLRVREVQARAA